MLSSMLCRPTAKSDAYPVLQKREWIILWCRTNNDFAKLINKMSRIECQYFCFVNDWRAADWFFLREAALCWQVKLWSGIWSPEVSGSRPEPIRGPKVERLFVILLQNWSALWTPSHIKWIGFLLLDLLSLINKSVFWKLSLAEFKPSAGRIFVKPPPAGNLRLSRI